MAGVSVGVAAVLRFARAVGLVPFPVLWAVDLVSSSSFLSAALSAFSPSFSERSRSFFLRSNMPGRKAYRRPPGTVLGCSRQRATNPFRPRVHMPRPTTTPIHALSNNHSPTTPASRVTKNPAICTILAQRASRWSHIRVGSNAAIQCNALLSRPMKEV
jgi:hypothetical protein